MTKTFLVWCGNHGSKSSSVKTSLLEWALFEFAIKTINKQLGEKKVYFIS